VLFEWVFGGDLCPVLSFLLLLLLKDFFLIHSPLVEVAGGGGLNHDINFHQKTIRVPQSLRPTSRILRWSGGICGYRGSVARMSTSCY